MGEKPDQVRGFITGFDASLCRIVAVVPGRVAGIIHGAIREQACPELAAEPRLPKRLESAVHCARQELAAGRALTQIAPREALCNA